MWSFVGIKGSTFLPNTTVRIASRLLGEFRGQHLREENLQKQGLFLETFFASAYSHK